MRIILFLYILLLSAILVAQEDYYLKEGDDYWQLLSYSKALESYKSCYRSNPENKYCILKMADCYQKMKDFKIAESWYSKVLKNDLNVDPMFIYNYALCLYTLGKIKEAQNWFLIYNQKRGEKDNRVSKYLQSISEHNIFYKDSSFIITELLDINSKSPDFGLCFYKEGAVFTSSRRNKRKQIQKAYFDIFYCSKLSKNSISNPKYIRSNINTRYHSGPCVFYDNYNKIIITHSYKPDKKKRENNSKNIFLQLYMGELVEGIEQDVKLSLLKLYDANNCHPAISNDGKTLIFASDYESGYGGMDLYISHYENDKWLKPENLGEKINTIGDEVFPYLFMDSVLFFASDGRGGLGNLDIYMINLSNKQSKATNLGYPFNSAYDDYAIVLDSTTRFGYFSSNRPGGIGEDDIYMFEKVKVKIRGRLYDTENDTVLINTEFTIVNGENKEIKLKTDSTGYFEFQLNPDETFKIIADVPEYKPEDFDFGSARDVNNQILDIGLEHDIKKIEIPNEPIKTVTTNKEVKFESIYVVIEFVDEKEKVKSPDKTTSTSYEVELPAKSWNQVKYKIIEK